MMTSTVAKNVGAAWLVLAFVGCIKPDLTPCGDLLCVHGDTCIANSQCASPDAITACNGVADASACQSPDGTGYCVNGACVANVCGDGIVTGNEVCDGSDVPVTCTDLGYYTGTPTCSAGCSIDHTGCSGRCGDGIVQLDQGELCDGAPPVQSCGDFGRDYGTLVCNRFCTPDIANDCFTYGWQEVLTPFAGVSENAAAVNAHGAVALYDTAVRVIWDGAESTQSTSIAWTFADADPDAFVVGNATASSWFDGTQWHDLAIGITGTAGNALSAGTVYELDADCGFRSFDLATGTLATLPAVGASSCTQLVASSGELVTITPAHAAAWDGTQWNAVGVGIPANTTLHRANGGRVWMSDQTNVDLVDLATGAQYRAHLSFAQDVCPDGDGDVLVINSSSGGSQISFEVSGATMAAQFAPPGSNPSGQASAEGQIFAYGSGVYRLNPLPAATITGAFDVARLSTLAPSAPSTSIVGDGTTPPPIDDGAIGVCATYSVGWFDATSTGAYVSVQAANSCFEMIGDPRTQFMFGDESGVWSSATSGYVVSGYALNVTGTVADTWANVDYAPWHGVSGAFSTIALPAGCSAELVAGGGGQPGYAVGNCNGVNSLFRYDAPNWTHLADVPLYVQALEVAPDGAVFVSSDVTSRLDGTSLTAIGQTTPHIVARGAGDVYLDLQTGVWNHYVNGALSSLRMPRGSLAVTPNAYYAVDYGNAAITIVPRMPTSIADAP